MIRVATIPAVKTSPILPKVEQFSSEPDVGLAENVQVGKGKPYVMGPSTARASR